MRVICVAKLEGFVGNTNDDIPVPPVMEECIVTGQGYHPVFGNKLLYQLSGYPNNIGYDARGFAILPNEEADDIEATEKEAIIPNPQY